MARTTEPRASSVLTTTGCSVYTLQPILTRLNWNFPPLTGPCVHLNKNHTTPLQDLHHTPPLENLSGCIVLQDFLWLSAKSSLGTLSGKKDPKPLSRKLLFTVCLLALTIIHLLKSNASAINRLTSVLQNNFGTLTPSREKYPWSKNEIFWPKKRSHSGIPSTVCAIACKSQPTLIVLLHL